MSLVRKNGQKNLNEMDLKKITKFLKQQKVIRIYFDSMPFGMGNQANSKNIILTLRHLGFEGKFECIYLKSEYLANKNKKTIANLFDLPDNFSDVYYDEESNIEFIELSIHLKALAENKVDRHGLSFSGGQFTICMDGLASTQIKISLKEAMSGTQCINQAKLLNTEVFINMQPYLGSTPNGDPVVSMNLHRSDKKIMPSFNAEEKFNHPYTESLQDVFHYLETSKRGNTLSIKKMGLIPLINAMQRNSISTLPIHGWPVQLPENNPGYPIFFPESILEYIAAARYAQLHCEKIAKKPIVIPVFYNYEKELGIIYNILVKKEWGEYRKWRDQNGGSTLDHYFESLNLAKIFKKTALADSDSIDIISNLVPGEILLVSVGKVPQVVFNGLYIDGGGTILTSIYEGANTLNALLSNGYKPFLRSASQELIKGYYGPKESTLLKSYIYYEFETSFIKRCEWTGNFVLSAQNDDSLLSKYFAWLYETARKPENNRLLNSLHQAITLLEKRNLYQENLQHEVSKMEHCGLFSQLSRVARDSILSKALEPVKNCVNTAFNTCDYVVNEAEKVALSYCARTLKECPSYFPKDHPFFWQSQIDKTCAEGYFQLGATCTSLPLISSLPHLVLPK